MTTVARFRVGPELGRGGGGQVHRAFDDSGASVVLKCARVEDGMDTRRFLREAELLKRLDHPHVARCLDAGRDGDWLWMAMPDDGAVSLTERVQTTRPGPGDPAIVRWLAHALAGLAALHALKVVHRDVKPDNLLVARDGTLKVADLGLAFQEGRSRLTASAAVVGSAAWLPPEALRGGRAEPVSDIYQWALVGYWLCAGALPFASDAPLAASSRRCFEPVPPLASVAPGVPALLSDLIERNLAPDPAHRSRDALELLEDLRTLAPEA
jgi:serine/threonine protein kinase